MKYFLDLFSPETATAFALSDRAVSGFRSRQRAMAERVKKGDRLLCYVTRVSRWIGILEVTDGPFEDDKPVFYPKDDPFTIRFRVKPIVWLDIEDAIPIHDDTVWRTLSMTKEYDKSSSMWTGKFRSSLNGIDVTDGDFISDLLLKQLTEKNTYPLSDSDKKKLKAHRVRTHRDEEVDVVVPTDEEETPTQEPVVLRESIRVQAKLCEIGQRMGYRIWLPKNDRGQVLECWTPEKGDLLDELPLNYDDTTLSTIEQIDVIWIKGRSIIRVFEVEHTTSIFSGILRMADLMALQPNLDIRAHIVAPPERKEKVLQEIRRPVFSLLEKGPLASSCSYLSYDVIEVLFTEKLIHHMTDSVLEEFADYSEV